MDKYIFKENSISNIIHIPFMIIYVMGMYYILADLVGLQKTLHNLLIIIIISLSTYIFGRLNEYWQFEKIQEVK